MKFHMQSKLHNKDEDIKLNTFADSRVSQFYP